VFDKISDENARRYVEAAVRSDTATEPRLTSALNGLKNVLMDDPRYVGGNRVPYAGSCRRERLHVRAQGRYDYRIFPAVAGSNNLDLCEVSHTPWRVDVRMRCEQESQARMTAMQNMLTDYTTALFLFMSVAFGPALVWVLVWAAS
jgi:hypothetical protein